MRHVVRLLAVSVLFLAGASQVSAEDPTVIESIQLGQTTCCSLSGVAVNPDTNRIYVTDPSRDELYVVDGTTHLLLDKITIGSRPWGVAVNPFTNQIFVASIDDQRIYVVDGVTGDVAVLGGEGLPTPLHLAVNHATNSLVATLPANDCICSIDCSAGEVAWVAPVDDRPNGVAVDTTRNVVWAAHHTGCLSVIHGDGGSWPEGRCPGQSLLDIAVNPVLRKAYATDRAARSILVVDTNTLGVVREAGVEGYPRAIAVNSLTGRVYVTVNDTVRVLDGIPEQIVSTVDVGAAPMGIAVNPLTERVYIVSFGGGRLDVIEDADPARPPVRVLDGYITRLRLEVDTLNGAPELSIHLERAIGVLRDEDDANDFKAALHLMEFIGGLDPTSKQAGNTDAKFVAAARRIVAMFVGS